MNTNTNDDGDHKNDNDHDVVNCDEEQENELEVLKSIYGDDFVEISTTNVWNVKRATERRFKLHITPYPVRCDISSSSTSDTVNYVAVWLDVSYTRRYPTTVPIIRVECDSKRPLSENYTQELLQQLNTMATEYVGEVMVYQLADAAQQYLRTRNRKPPSSLHDQMMQTRKKAAEAEQETLQRAAAEKEAEVREHLQHLAARVEAEKKRKIRALKRGKQPPPEAGRSVSDSSTATTNKSDAVDNDNDDEDEEEDDEVGGSSEDTGYMSDDDETTSSALAAAANSRRHQQHMRLHHLTTTTTSTTSDNHQHHYLHDDEDDDDDDDDEDDDEEDDDDDDDDDDEKWFAEQQRQNEISYGVHLPSESIPIPKSSLSSSPPNKQRRHPVVSSDEDLYGTSPSSRSSSEMASIDEKTGATAPVASSSAQYSRYRSDFEELGLLGRGGFGEVWKVRNKIDGLLYAVKKIKLTRHRPALRRKIMREVLLIARLHHQYIVRYFQAWVETNTGPDVAAAPADPRELGQTHALDMGIEPEDMFSEEDGGGDGGGDDTRQDWLSADARSLSRSQSQSLSRPFLHDRSQSSHSALNSVSHHSGLEDEDDDGDDDDGMFDSEDNGGGRDIRPSKMFDVLYIQMEWCAGQTLKFAISQGAIQRHMKTVWRLFRQTLEAISFIHSEGIIHRDIKPDNIFIDSQGNIKLGDFGLALAGGKQLDSSVTEVVGTPFYRSPEQEAEGVGYDHKADLYAMGVILYEMTHTFGTAMERVMALTTLRKTGRVPDTVPPYAGADSVRAVIEWLVCEQPQLRPSANELLRSGKIPVSLEDEFLAMAIAHAKIPRTPFHQQLLDALFSATIDDIVDLTFDYQASSNSVTNNPSSSAAAAAAATANGFDASVASVTSGGSSSSGGGSGVGVGIGVDGVQQSSPMAHWHTQMGIFDEVTRIFRRHGAVPFSTPLIMPTPSKRKLPTPSHAVTYLDTEGVQVQLPYCLTIPFARYVARNAEQLCGTMPFRRYDIAKVFRRNTMGSGSPKELYECDFDIVWHNSSSRSDDDDETADVYKEAEVIFAIHELLTHHKSAVGSFVIRINHAELLEAVLDEVLTFNVDMTSTEVRNVYHQISQPKLRFPSPLHAPQRAHSVLPPPLSLTDTAMSTSPASKATTTTTTTTAASKKPPPPPAAAAAAAAAATAHKQQQQHHHESESKEQQALLDTIRSDILSHLKKRQVVGTDTQTPWSWQRSTLKRRLYHHYQHVMPAKNMERLGMYLDLRSNKPDAFFRKLRNTLMVRSKRRSGANGRISRAIDHLKSVHTALEAIGVKDVQLDLSVIVAAQFQRDGLVFHVDHGTDTLAGPMKLLAVGGRYDSLVSKFRPLAATSGGGSTRVCAVGMSFAVEKLTACVLNWREKVQERNFRAKLANQDKKVSKEAARISGTGDGVLLQAGSRENMLEERVHLAVELWARGIRAEWSAPVNLTPESTRQYCLESGLRFVVAFRSRSYRVNRVVKVKDLHSKDPNQWTAVPVDQLLESITLAQASPAKVAASSTADIHTYPVIWSERAATERPQFCTMSSAGALDFFSEEFDPMLALNTPDLQPPLVNVQPRDHIGKCQSLLHPSDENYRKSRPIVRAASAIVEPPPPPPPQQQQQQEPPMLTRFNSDFRVQSNDNRDGPLLILKELYEQQCYVHVRIRRAASVRGWCEGVLMAFDRHMNMILMDCNEWHDEIHRHVKQLFIRGDNVVLVCRQDSDARQAYTKLIATQQQQQQQSSLS